MRSLLAFLLLTPVLRAQSEHETGFDRLPVGAFTRLEDGPLELRAAAGQAEIDAAHARSGDRCLRLLGGAERTLELRADLDVRRLSFHGERWTRRAPFALRLEVRRGSRWETVWDGTHELRVGRGFLSHVVIDVDPPTRRLRLVATSPEDTGVLIDDLRLAAAAPGLIETVRAVQTVRPVLFGKPWSPLIGLEIEVRGNQDLPVLGAIEFALLTTDPAALEATTLRMGSSLRDSVEAPLERVGLRFSGRLPLGEGPNRLWLAARPASDLDLDASVDARVVSVALADGTPLTVTDPDPPGRLRVGVALRDAGDDGVHTYRIPALVRTPRGTLIATYDVRRQRGGDLPGDIDVGVQRSTDGGRSWSAMELCLDMGRPHGQNGVGDPCALVDPATGRVFVFALWSQGGNGWNGSGPGLSPEETGQLVLTWSDDEGVTWSAPRNLTAELKDPRWRLFLQSPGNGIALADGTLVCPAQYRDGDGVPHSTVIVSEDHGRTWRVGAGARDDTTESRVVELPGGVLMLNMRDNRRGSRAVMISRDLGRSWEDHASSRGALVGPVCNAGLTRGDDGRLWFVNPAVPSPPRRRTTLKASDDQGLTWPHERLLFEPTSAGYPSLVAMGEHLGVLYEGGEAAHLIFERVRIDEVVGD